MEQLRRHAMLDFETLSLRKNALLLCAGVVVFDRQTENINSQLWHLNLTTQSDILKRHIDPQTVIWWMNQSAEAQARVFVPESERVHLATFLHQLKEFLFWNDVERVWCKGPTADGAWLESLCDEMQMPCPVQYRAWRDVRTIEDRLPAGIEFDESDIVPHDPISDCIAQIRRVRATWSN